MVTIANEIVFICVVFLLLKIQQLRSRKRSGVKQGLGFAGGIWHRKEGAEIGVYL